jgi:hypothetical protein
MFVKPKKTKGVVQGLKGASEKDASGLRMIDD